MTNKRSAHKEYDVDHNFGRLARSPGGVSREAALQRAAAEVERLKPQVTEHIRQEFKRLEAALRSARSGDQPAAIAEAYAASQNLRDVAESVGYSLIGLIATNLCTIFEAVETARIAYPAAIIDCHFKALHLSLSDPYHGKKPHEFPELSAGLAQLAQIAKETTADPDPALSKKS
jgi:hypothetical protein